MRSTLRALAVLAWATLAPACSSLGGVELQDGAEGRFTAGDDGDPTDPDSGSPTHPEGDSDESTSDRPDDDAPLEPPQGTDGPDDAGSTGLGDAESEGTDGGATESESSSDGGLDDGTTGLDPQTNGVDSASATTDDTGECTDEGCLPSCDPSWARSWEDFCDQPCARDAVACVTEGGIVLSCEMGLWSCGP